MNFFVALIVNGLFIAIVFYPTTHADAWFSINKIKPGTHIDSIPKSTIVVEEGDTTQIFQVPTKDQLKNIPKIWLSPVSKKDLLQWGFDVEISEDGTLAWWSDDPGGEKFGTIKVDDCATVIPVYFRHSKNESYVSLAIKCEAEDEGMIRSDATRKAPDK